MKSDFLATHLDGDAASCQAASTQLARLVRQLRDAEAGLVHEPGNLRGWEGPASTAWRVRTAERAAEAADLTTRLELVGMALEDLARGLDAVGGLLQRARDVAAGGGLVVTAGGILGPPPAIGAGPTGQLDAWATASALVGDARAQETSAHAIVRGRLETACAPGVTATILSAFSLTAPEGDALDVGSWCLGIGSTATGLMTKRARAALLDSAKGVFRFGVDEAELAGSRAAIASGGAKTVGIIAKRAGLAGSVLTVALDGREQWRADSDDERLSHADKVGRTIVRGAVEGGFTVAGATILGGICSPIPGGTLVGGAIGGYGGHIVGKFAADVAVEQVDEVIDAAEDVGDAVRDAAGAVADAGGAALDTADEIKDEAVDKAKDVGKKLCFWD